MEVAFRVSHTAFLTTPIADAAAAVAVWCSRHFARPLAALVVGPSSGPAGHTSTPVSAVELVLNFRGTGHGYNIIHLLLFLSLRLLLCILHYND